MSAISAILHGMIVLQIRLHSEKKNIVLDKEVQTVSFEIHRKYYRLRCELCVVYESRHEKASFCKREHKGADQLCGNRAADQRLCLRYITRSLYFLNPKFQVSSHLLLLYGFMSDLGSKVTVLCSGPCWKL